jgi:hypothetical protein
MRKQQGVSKGSAKKHRKERPGPGRSWFPLPQVSRSSLLQHGLRGQDLDPDRVFQPSFNKYNG